MQFISFSLKKMYEFIQFVCFYLLTSDGLMADDTFI